MSYQPLADVQLPAARSTGNCGSAGNSGVETAMTFRTSSFESTPPPRTSVPAGQRALRPDTVPGATLNVAVTTLMTPASGAQIAATLAVPDPPSFRTLP